MNELIHASYSGTGSAGDFVSLSTDLTDVSLRYNMGGMSVSNSDPLYSGPIELGSHVIMVGAFSQATGDLVATRLVGVHAERQWQFSALRRSATYPLLNAVHRHLAIVY